MAGGDDAVNGLAVQADGDVVAAGSAAVAGVTEVAVARFLPDGTLDRRFGSGGVVTSSPGGLYDAAESVAVRPTGQVVVGGVSASGTAADPAGRFLVQQYTARGRVDRSFGDHGSTFTAFGRLSAVTQIALGADGSVVATGPTAATPTGVADLAVARYTAGGRPDPTFAGTGRAVVDLGGGGDEASAAAITRAAVRRPAVERPAILRPADTAADAGGLAAAFGAFTAAAPGDGGGHGRGCHPGRRAGGDADGRGRAGGGRAGPGRGVRRDVAGIRPGRRPGGGVGGRDRGRDGPGGGRRDGDRGVRRRPGRGRGGRSAVGGQAREPAGDAGQVVPSDGRLPVGGGDVVRDGGPWPAGPA